ncbi:MAG TPA: hypothetical protein VL793_01470 [Patescibacteria group bacterium]|nr:hypothetical protein [Patescibacteria group bacterium]
MKTLQKDELFENLQGFLKAKGVDIKEGSYAQKLQRSCSLLSDAINAGQEGLTRAKAGIDRKLDQLRQVIHEKTAPSSRSAAPPAQSQTSPPGAAKSAKSKRRTGKRPSSRKGR